jgi:beta-xylosidase
MPIQTVSGRSYQIWVSRDLREWTLQSTLSGNNSEQLFRFDETAIVSGPLHSPVHPSNYFFRVQIVMP